jgi:tRNA-dihydrouridine synthase B
MAEGFLASLEMTVLAFLSGGGHGRAVPLRTGRVAAVKNPVSGRQRLATRHFEEPACRRRAQRREISLIPISEEVIALKARNGGGISRVARNDRHRARRHCYTERIAMIPECYKIRDLEIQPATVLAPMAGVTDTLFRRVIRGLGGCGLLMTEFTSSEGITRSAKKTLRYLYFQDDEHPITAQLFGANPQVMADAARMVEDLGYDAVDINLGCPAKKVVKCGGSGLLRDLPLLGEIFRAVRAAVRIPLTIKLRAGWDENSIVAVEVARMAEDCGVEGVAVHPRTREQGYTGRADWTLIAAVKRSVRIPVIGNGDVNAPEDAERMVKETGCDGVMIGRAAATNPWIFAQMAQYAATGRYDTPTDTDRHHLLSDYYQQISAANLPDGVGKMKQFACWFSHGVGNGSELRRSVHAARTQTEVLESVERFFEHRGAAVDA